MKNYPIIGIIARSKKQDNGKNFIGIYENYLRKITNNGGIPLIISEIDKDKLLKILKLCDGIILPGGDELTDFDSLVNEFALDNDIPLLGICLGMQVMAINDGSNEIEIPNHYLISHDIYLNKNTKLKKIIKKNTILVNSRHHFKITKPNNYIISALALDGTIEAIERKDKLFNIGVQWHPEDLTDDSLFKELINMSKKRQNK